AEARGSLHRYALTLSQDPARLPDRKQDSAHDVLRHAPVAKLIQLKRVLPSVGALLGQIPTGLGPEHERDRIRAGYRLKGGYQPVVARVTRKSRRVLRVNQN